jgi:hypothetical protein
MTAAESLITPQQGEQLRLIAIVTPAWKQKKLSGQFSVEDKSAEAVTDNTLIGGTQTLQPEAGLTEPIVSEADQAVADQDNSNVVDDQPEDDRQKAIDKLRFRYGSRYFDMFATQFGLDPVGVYDLHAHKRTDNASNIKSEAVIMPDIPDTSPLVEVTPPAPAVDKAVSADALLPNDDAAPIVSLPDQVEDSGRDPYDEFWGISNDGSQHQPTPVEEVAAVDAANTQAKSPGQHSSIRDRILRKQLAIYNRFTNNSGNNQVNNPDGTTTERKRRVNASKVIGALTLAGMVAFVAHDLLSGGGADKSSLSHAANTLHTGHTNEIQSSLPPQHKPIDTNMHYITQKGAKAPVTANSAKAPHASTKLAAATTKVTSTSSTHIDTEPSWNIAQNVTMNPNTALNTAAQKFNELYGSKYVLTNHGGAEVFMNGSQMINPHDQSLMNGILEQMR